MKILLVCDNRDNLNWGCRATSIALSLLLKRKFKITSTIHKKIAENQIVVWKYPRLFEQMPEKLKKLAYGIFKYSLKIQKLIGEQVDLVRLDRNDLIYDFIKNIHFQKVLKSIYNKISEADIIVINGEGSMIFTNPPRQDLLFQLMMIEITAGYFRKPVYYVNAMMSDCPIHGHNEDTAIQAVEGLKRCNAVAFRDLQSLENAKTIDAKLNCKFVPDALFSWAHYFENCESNIPSNGDFVISFPERDEYFGQYYFSGDYICIGGSSLAAWTPEEAIPAYCSLLQQLKKYNAEIYLVQTCRGDAFLKEVAAITHTPLIPVETSVLLGGVILANARIMISGRYHPSIFASLGGTPCIFLGSNSHKTRSLQEILEYDDITEYNAIPTDSDVIAISKKAKLIIQKGNGLRDQIKKVSKRRGEETNKLLKIIKN